ncbi:peptidoglycan-binding protein [Kitasatospora sp. NPDC101183]|uniref:peptidoglycan-binding domain-containing protein n=1 Tax=Kitasatospora sp. NPDC101183 TaxID=3364100 RepID=UPI003827A62D
MRHIRTIRRAATALAATALLGALTAPAAHADPGIPTVGYGYPNWSPSVRCIQYYVNQLTDVHILEDSRFGPETELGIRRIQQLASTKWAAAPLIVDGYFGPATGQAVLERIKKYPWLVNDFQKASTCGHYVPSHTVVLN